MRGKLKTPKRKKILRTGIEAGWAPSTAGNRKKKTGKFRGFEFSPGYGRETRRDFYRV